MGKKKESRGKGRKMEKKRNGAAKMDEVRGIRITWAGASGEEKG